MDSDTLRVRRTGQEVGRARRPLAGADTTLEMLKVKVGKTKIEDEAGEEWQICETSVYFRYGGMAARRHLVDPSP